MLYCISIAPSFFYFIFLKNISLLNSLSQVTIGIGITTSWPLYFLGLHFFFSRVLLVMQFKSIAVFAMLFLISSFIFFGFYYHSKLFMDFQLFQSSFIHPNVVFYVIFISNHYFCSLHIYLHIVLSYPACLCILYCRPLSVSIVSMLSK